MVDRKQQVLIVFGTRPEAIKIAPLAQEFARHPQVEAHLCCTGQHEDLVDGVIEAFGMDCEYRFHAMEPGQDVNHILSKVINGVASVLSAHPFDWVIVQGDTTSALGGALAAFNAGVAIAHVEAGLRTGDFTDPFPEEGNRKLIDAISTKLYPPTPEAEQNLIREGYHGDLLVTGNTAIDALKMIDYEDDDISDELNGLIDRTKRLILLTMHRRESRGMLMEGILEGIADSLATHADVSVIWPMHPAREVREMAHTIFDGNERVHLIRPLEYVPFHKLMSKSYLVVTDSGGVEEEAPSLNKPVLVVRDHTEREEGVEAGCLRLVGRNRERVRDALNELLDTESEYRTMAESKNPYGDGTASKKIVSNLLEGD